jgi:hypothetical protein
MFALLFLAAIAAPAGAQGGDPSIPWIARDDNGTRYTRDEIIGEIRAHFGTSLANQIDQATQPGGPVMIMEIDDRSTATPGVSDYSTIAVNSPCGSSRSP